MEENKERDRSEVYSERVRAGKRTYFFDIKSTRSNDYYLTITESKRRYKDDGFYYEKHKIFLYKEDFDKFLEALNVSINHVKTELLPDVDFSQFDNSNNNNNNNNNNGNEPAEKVDAETPATTDDTELSWD